MLDTLNALLDQPLLLMLVLAAGAACGIAVERLVEGQKRAEQRAFWNGRKQGGHAKAYWRRTAAVIPIKGTPERARHDAADQLRRVMEARFTARPLLNKPERRLIAVLDEALAQHTPGWRAMGQVSLIFDAEFRPLHAIEFQGSGHYLGNNSAARDAVKKEALRRAGIGYVEVMSGDTPAEVRAVVRKLAARQAA